MSTIFYINPLRSSIEILLLDSEKRTVIESHSIEKTGNDYERIPNYLVKLKARHFPREIWCVTGPGPFTLMRVITLSINGLAFLQKIKLKGAHLFDVIEHSNKELTPIIEANMQEYLYRKNGEDIVVKKNIVPKGKYIGISEHFVGDEYTYWESDIESIIDYFSGLDDELRLSAQYIKPPNITTSEKSR